MFISLRTPRLTVHVAQYSAITARYCRSENGVKSYGSKIPKFNIANNKVRCSTRLGFSLCTVKTSQAI